MPNHDHDIPQLVWDVLPEQSEGELQQAAYDRLTRGKPMDDQPTGKEIIDEMKAMKAQLLADRRKRKKKATDEIIKILTEPAQDLGETI